MSTELYLIGNNGFAAKIHKSMTIGRDWCRVYGDDYKWVSREQFSIHKTAEAWRMEGIRDLVNSTLLNGREITQKITSLSNDDVISVGKLKLIVKLVGEVRKTGECKKIMFVWEDHFGSKWNWSYDLPIRSVRDAQKEFGLSKDFFIDPFYLNKKGFKRNGIYTCIDYPKIAQKNVERLKDISNSLFCLAESKYANDKYKQLSFFLSFVQTISYKVPPEKSKTRKIYSFFTPPEVLYWGFGDCDSKSVLLASLWRNLNSASIAFVEIPNHLLLSFSNIMKKEENPYLEYITIEGKNFLLCEAAGPGLCPPGKDTTLKGDNIKYQTIIF